MKKDNDKSRAIGARFSHEQVAVILDYLNGERPTDYVRRLITADLAVHGIALPEYDFVDNAQRIGKRIPWIVKKP